MRAAELTKELLTFSKQDFMNIVELDINNLVADIAESMHDGGTLTVETYNTEFSKNNFSDFPNIMPGNFVCCSISDTGAGMSQEVKDRVFEPFYSTKDLGAGLGLASAYGIVQKHMGWIDVISEVGIGSTFKIYISTEIC